MMTGQFLVDAPTWSAMLKVWLGRDEPAIVTPPTKWAGHELMGGAAGAAAHLPTLGVQEGTPIPALLTSNATSAAYAIGAASNRRPLAPLGPRLTIRELTA